MLSSTESAFHTWPMENSKPLRECFLCACHLVAAPLEVSNEIDLQVLHRAKQNRREIFMCLWSQLTTDRFPHLETWLSSYLWWAFARVSLFKSSTRASETRGSSESSDFEATEPSTAYIIRISRSMVLCSSGATESKLPFELDANDFCTA